MGSKLERPFDCYFQKSSLPLESKGISRKVA